VIQRETSAHVQPEHGDLHDDECNGNGGGEDEEKQACVGAEAQTQQGHFEPSVLHRFTPEQVLQRVNMQRPSEEREQRDEQVALVLAKGPAEFSAAAWRFVVEYDGTLCDVGVLIDQVRAGMVP
jgi:hypothetical protein